MSLNQRFHIGIFGKTNCGKSSLVNFLCDQEISIVSEISGTTTDAVKKNFELGNLGACVLVDTAGIEDDSILGKEREKATFAELEKIDFALLLFEENISASLFSIAEKLIFLKTPFIFIHTKNDFFPLSRETETAISEWQKTLSEKIKNLTHPEVEKLYGGIFSLSTKANCKSSKTKEELIKKIEAVSKANEEKLCSLLSGLIEKEQTLLLITPIDSAAPKGRLILPQVQVLREALDLGCLTSVIQPEQLSLWLEKNSNPALVITDSQVFSQVAKLVPADILLTGFSMVLARVMGPFELYASGVEKISSLQNNDKVLILESCNHTVTCEDIGRVKLPKMLQEKSGKKLDFTFIQSLEPLPQNLSDYSLVLQCGGCMVTKKQLSARLAKAIELGIPITNYGMALAYLSGVFERAILPFKQKGLVR